MTIDKLSYTKNEKTAEIAGSVTLGAIEADYIGLMAAGILSGIAILMAVVSAVMYGIFSVVSVYPQHTNIVKKSTTEHELHKIRTEAIASKIILAAVMFGMTFVFRL